MCKYEDTEVLVNYYIYYICISIKIKNAVIVMYAFIMSLLPDEVINASYPD